MFVIWRDQREISRYGALMKDKLSMSNSYKLCSVWDRVNVKVSTFHSLVSGQDVLGPKCPEPTARSLTWLMNLFVSWAPGLHRFCGTTDYIQYCSSKYRASWSPIFCLRTKPPTYVFISYTNIKFVVNK